ncbi:glycosyltransferase [Actinotalea sp. M2MS4P-6]|uniref:glycosyltransferase n=1 Tax=Actinotalea sp. M2MS4P-6 TaxID=2983762 RepID=UPI0021E5148A|nr:glycosyltransferase [Actinotalea sp. M2MS4P-6]MCV2394184.1 glycosyltransferase [Actinotalea sp. M2MS4P-6]
MRVLADAFALQHPATAPRGIGRWVHELAAAVEDHEPGAIDAWLLRPGLPVPAHTPALVRAALLRRSDDPDLRPPDVWLQPSPLEPLTGELDDLWPTWARGPRTRLVTVLYDLIPLAAPERYLAARAARAAYLARLELVRSADRVLTISRATADDAIRLLGLPANRLEVVGTGVSEHFTPGPDEPSAVTAVPGLRPGYLLCPGGADPRKNVDLVLRAYAELDRAERRAHPLVLLHGADPAVIDARVAELGLGDHVHPMGHVSEVDLLTLYRNAALVVFPSLHEGFGLPVAEARACGTPSVVADVPALAELVTDDAGRFDPTSVSGLVDVLRRALGDPELRARLLRTTGTGRPWAQVAESCVTAIRDLPAVVPGRPRVALISPMPPVPSGVADYSRAMLDRLRERADVDVFTEPGAEHPPLDGVAWYTYRDLRSVERAHGDHDARIIAMGNSEHHLETLAALRAHGGTVISHDVRYSDLLGVALRERPDLVDPGTRARLAPLHAGKVPDEHRGSGLDAAEYWTVNGLMAGPVVEPSDRTVVHSRVAAALARADLDPPQRAKVSVVPFGHTLRTPGSQRDTVASFGIVHWQKESVTVVRAFAALAHEHPQLRFALVGRSGDPRTGAEVAEVIESAGLGDRLVLTGRVTAAEYDAWLARSLLAVQLRSHSNGETSAAVADCLGAGVPVVVSRTGALAELADCTTQVEPGIAPRRLARVIDDLISDAAQRESLADRGRAHAVGASFRVAADAVLDLALGGSA